MSAKIISVANRKGGVGKTTMTIILATALAIDKKKKVLLLDCDNQRSAFDYFSIQKQVYGEDPPYEIRTLHPKYIFDELRYNSEKFDIIFIDIPRMTDDSKDGSVIQVLTCCDTVLIPVVAGNLEALSTRDFIKTLKGIESFKKERDIPFQYIGFLNKKNRRKENAEAVEFMAAEGVKMLKNPLGDVKLFTTPSVYESILDSKEGKTRFEPFFDEFLKTCKI
ncbi:MAG: chromosome partitioning protein [Maribacter sp.]|jgi:chromosome partitioning protein